MTAMRHDQFQIGSLFVCGDQRWRCTDVGTRTIVAILLDHDDDPSWYRGPPYAVAETVFDEDDQVACDQVDERVLDVRFDEHSLIVDLMDGRAISAPLAWYPRLLRASTEQRSKWETSGAGYGIHWPDIGEDLSIEGLLCGAPAAKAA